MDYYDRIEPIHELPSDELEDRLDHVLEDLKFLWAYKGDREDSSFKEISHDVDFDLQTIIHSIKKSLLYFFPDWTYELSLVTNANEARHLLNILQNMNPRYWGFEEGLEAILRIYLEVGPHFQCNPEDELLSFNDYQEMKLAILKYASIAREEYLLIKMDEAEPFIEKGKKFKQSQSIKAKSRWEKSQNERKSRNLEIKELFKKSNLTKRSFAVYYAKKYKLSISQFYNILKE